MYQLSDSLTAVKGIGDELALKFLKQEIRTIKDLLLWVPLRYEDRSTQKQIKELVRDELVTFQAKVVTASNQYRGKRSIQRATVQDETGQVKLIWFNQPYIVETLKQDSQFFFSGKLDDRGQVVQAKVEKISTDTTHTNRLVPVYSAIADLKIGNIRRFLKEIINHLGPITDPLAEQTTLLELNQTFKHLHFPADETKTIQARERLALEELLGLMKHSQQIKAHWQNNQAAHRVETKNDEGHQVKLPFSLTKAQQRSLDEILNDLNSSTPMNRLLIGDVGSGKTIVVILAALEVIAQNQAAVLVAPTQILAKQHLQSIKSFFPELPIQLVTAQDKFIQPKKATLFIGTHAVINQLDKIKPAFVIYDEQHRFGVKQRSQIEKLTFQPHLLTMSATPIPRSLMLTIFAHLELSLIDELPPGRKITKTWLVPTHKRAAAYTWLEKELTANQSQALVVCPFVSPSKEAAFSQVAAATDVYEKLQADLPDLKIGLLHGQQKKAEQQEIITRLYDQQIQVLVTTPIVEVGVDLPTADIMLIESAQRFGLASLHQLRGRVGRAGQQAYCLLFSNSKSIDSQKRLSLFTKYHDGMKLAEHDLDNRGAGDLFGTDQHGFDQLRFATWTNLELIKHARQLFEIAQGIDNWRPLLEIPTGDQLQPN